MQPPHAEAPRSGLEGRSKSRRRRLERPSRPRFAAPQHEGPSAAFRNSSCKLGLERARRIEPALDCRPNGGGDLVFGSVGVDDDATQRLGCGDFEERPPQGLVKRQPLRFEPVGRPRLSSLACPLQADYRIEVEDQSQVGSVCPHRQAFKRGDELRRSDSPPRLDRHGSNRRTGRRRPRLRSRAPAESSRSRWSVRAAANSKACPAALKSAANPERIASRKASAPDDPPAPGFERPRSQKLRDAPRAA